MKLSLASGMYRTATPRQQPIAPSPRQPLYWLHASSPRMLVVVHCEGENDASRPSISLLPLGEGEDEGSGDGKCN